ncbi:MAG: 4-hydroxy-tetrahydrodipicolinate synthase [Chloroflexi bacterium]|nr:4-hydroxy-tetrahydrodipicolinate synthase [Chloroflexota bacterium]
MVTPFDEKGAVDYAQARRLAQALMASGSDGLVVSGTTGESPTLTKEEKLRLYAEVKEAIADRGAVIAGTGTYATAESVELTRAAERAGADAILAVVPYYNKPTQEGLYQHFRAIAAATRLPCIPYNIPGRTGVNMAPETVIRLSAIDNIAGIKEASGNLEQWYRILDGVKRADFLIWSGNDSDTYPLMALGGYGVISVVTHLVGRQFKDMMDKTLAGQTRAAAQSHLHLLPLMQAMVMITNPIPVKYALNAVGFQVGKPRLPLTEPDAKTAQALDGILKGFAIDLPLAPARA